MEKSQRLEGRDWKCVRWEGGREGGHLNRQHKITGKFLHVALSSVFTKIFEFLVLNPDLHLDVQ